MHACMHIHLEETCDFLVGTTKLHAGHISDSRHHREREREEHSIVPANKADEMSTVFKPLYTRPNESLMN